MKLVFTLVFAALVLTGLAAFVLGLQFARSIGALESQLTETRPAPPRADLPAPLHAFALRGMRGAVPAGSCQLAQDAEMRLKKAADWQPLAARQVIAAATPGFAWVAAQRFGPLPVVRVIDSYVGGAGLLEVRLLGAVRIGREDGPEAALGEALRYLAELPWCPDAILTNPEISWVETADGLSAALATSGGEARVSFSFDAAGDITGMQAKGRPATLPDGSTMALDWQGSFTGYAEIGGRRIPTQGEVGYHYPDGYEAYWRGVTTSYGVSD